MIMFVDVHIGEDRQIVAALLTVDVRRRVLHGAHGVLAGLAVRDEEGTGS